jgi:hypothetical protein
LRKFHPAGTVASKAADHPLTLPTQKTPLKQRGEFQFLA